MEEKRGACVRSERERKRRRVAVGERVVCLCLVGMMCVMLCAVAMEACNEEAVTNFVPALVARAA